jgi:hypothetical protein
MRAYFAAEEGARKWLTIRAKRGRNGPNGAEMRSGSQNRS